MPVLAMEAPLSSLSLSICHRCEFRQKQCAGPCACLADPQRRDIIEHAESLGCPKGYFEQPPPMPQKATTDVPRDRRLWKTLHLRAAKFNGDALAEMAFLYRLGTRLRGSACSCQAKFADRISAAPPDLFSSLSYAIWTFDLHNAKNRELGKPIFTWEEGMRRYGWPARGS